MSVTKKIILLVVVVAVASVAFYFANNVFKNQKTALFKTSDLKDDEAKA